MTNRSELLTIGASFLGHLEELRRRLIKSAVAVVIGSIVGYSFCDKLIRILAEPVGKLVFTSPTEAFATYLKVSIWSGLFLSSPYVIYQVWKFISEGLKISEKKYFYMFMPASFALFVSGAAFGFFVVIRFGIKFLLAFGEGFMTPMITISKYISFVSALCLAFGAVFQLPLVMLLLAKVGLITAAQLRSKRKFAVILIFIAAGLLTPGPDIFSQFCMAVPLLILYEAGIILAGIVSKNAEGVSLNGQRPFFSPVKVGR